MKWLKIFILIFLIYVGATKQHVYYSSAQETRIDARVTALNSYLTARHSPLAQEAHFFVKTADTYKLDYRLLPAIAGVESGFETAGNIYDYNPFGIMCGSSPCVFDSYEQAITTAAKTISRDSAYQGFRRSGSLIDLAQVYCQGDNQKWANTLSYFESKL